METANGKKEGMHKGIVVSDAMTKTIVVAVSHYKTHPKYHKGYRVTKRYKVHDPEERYAVGDTVSFMPSRPISAGKRHTVVYTEK
ncbi:MAG TPA: 30S ribosomal protein S17 [Patescibacteria group bacterium]|nr:30S ribosomal protein S17 [Patescibacteria group bacterium]